MDPIRVIAYVAVAAVVTLLILGGVAFYAGYSAGRGVVAQFTGADVGGETSAAAQSEIERLNRTIAELRKQLSEKSAQTDESRQAEMKASAEKVAALSEELSQTKGVLSEQQEELTACRKKLAALETGAVATGEPEPATPEDQPEETAAREPAEQPADDSTHEVDGKVLLYDRFDLRRQTTRKFDEVGLEFGLQTVASKSASVKINGQQVSMKTREGKRILHRGVTCELILLETDLGKQEARFSIACKK